jgi:hypothetical protein
MIKIHTHTLMPFRGGDQRMGVASVGQMPSGLN